MTFVRDNSCGGTPVINFWWDKSAEAVCLARKGRETVRIFEPEESHRVACSNHAYWHTICRFSTIQRAHSEAIERIIEMNWDRVDEKLRSKVHEWLVWVDSTVPAVKFADFLSTIFQFFSEILLVRSYNRPTAENGVALGRFRRGRFAIKSGILGMKPESSPFSNSFIKRSWICVIQICGSLFGSGKKSLMSKHHLEYVVCWTTCYCPSPLSPSHLLNIALAKNASG